MIKTLITLPVIKKYSKKIKSFGVLNQIGVLNPIALTTHHPVHPSNIENKPPPMAPAGKIQIQSMSKFVRNIIDERTMPANTPKIPNFNLTALPRASILHSNLVH